MLIWSLVSAARTKRRTWGKAADNFVFLDCGSTCATGLSFWGGPRDSEAGHNLAASSPCWQRDRQRDTASDLLLSGMMQ